MRQYARFKKAHPGCILLFRIGDFYEMFDDDAVTVSRAIGLTLTQRTAGVPMCGMPYHQLETYLRRLIEQGFRVAVCDQVQDAAEAKGVIERDVTRVLTPGTLVDETLLADDQAGALAAVCFPPDEPPTAAGPVLNASTTAMAVVELSTGAFSLLRCAPQAAADELARRGVSEVLYPGTLDGAPPARLAPMLTALGIAGTAQPQWHFRPAEAGEALREQFGVRTLAGFGLSDEDPLVGPAGAVVRYLRAMAAPRGGETDGAAASKRPVGSLAHLRPPRREEPGDELMLDASTFRSLEIDRTMRTGRTDRPAGAPGTVDGSLASIFTGRASPRTPMGRRLVRQWLCRPLARPEPINARQAIVATLVADRRAAEELRAALAPVQDVQRIAARIALRRATPRDLVALARSLAQVESLSACTANAPALADHRGRFEAAAEGVRPLAERIAEACVDDPPAHLRDGGLIRDGVDAELDEARRLKTSAGQWLAEYQTRLVAEHGLPSLKVGYNRIFGYYIELPKAQAARAPAAFSRRQTLTGAERFITPELKEFEDKVTTASGRAVAREQAMFDALCDQAGAVLGPIAAFGDAAAELDVLAAFAEKAVARRWVRPVLSPEPVLSVRQGRHPVLDELLENAFVPNDLSLGGGGPGLALITGPNMAGKSTFIRQTALLVLLAHTGSFVPAEEATIGLTDRIFTRVGADDALFAGQSTFMVEMTETASILHHATARSLVVLDEIGRGTSTLDGLSLAWAVAERLASPEPPPRGNGGPRTLFATHYHELTGLQERLEGRVTNLHVSVREWTDESGHDHIAFLHRIVPGRTDRSYGIHVARLAGIPPAVIARAGEILESLSVAQAGGPGAAPAQRTEPRPAPAGQLPLFTEYIPHPAIDALREVKIDAITPLQAFDELRRLQGLARRTKD
ncbi:MAG: DNA mismatch repair protein MutS [Phycisphaeraceae bacterium]|nr:DNA mismatch repair protein MutS [Phycisphaeraceae bacterium]